MQVSPNNKDYGMRRMLELFHRKLKVTKYSKLEYKVAPGRPCLYVLCSVYMYTLAVHWTCDWAVL